MTHRTRRIFRGRHVLLTTAAACAVLMAGGAHAQDTAQNGATAQDDSTTVVVTGIRRALQDSITLKKKSTSIIEAVSAEDIGKLPDVSIAESLARLPGLAAQRVNGRAQVISIRGLSPDFSTTLLNGRLQVSTGDNRAAEFDQYPSELVNSAIVYKTPDASLVGQGLSGTVDLHTIQPLDYHHRVVSIGVRGSHNSNGKLNADSDVNGNRLSFAYIDQFMDGKLGIALGYAHLDDPSQTRHSKRWWWDVQGGRFGPGHDNALGLHGVEAWSDSREQVRDGYMGIVEFKPNDNFHSVNDLYYSKFNQTDTTRGVMWYQTQWADDISFTDSRFAQVHGGEVWTGGTVNGIVPIVRNDYNDREDKMYSIGSKNTWSMANWRMLADLGYSHSERNEVVSETYAGYGTDPTPLTRTFDSIHENVGFSGFPILDPDLNYGDASQVYLGDVAPWGGWGHDGTIRYPHVTDELITARLQGSHDLAWGPFSSVDLGVDFSKRTKEKAVDEYNLCLKGWVDDGSGNCHGTRVPVASNYLVQSTDLGWAGFGPILSFDIPAVEDTYYDKLAIKDESNYDKFWGVEEKLSTAFFKFNIESHVFGIPVRGNLGVQAVQAEQTSSGYLTRPGTPVTFAWFAQTTKYTDVLPSLNLIFDISDKDLLRLGVGKAMARPRMDDMRANVSAGVDTTKGTWSGSGGNPTLKPWLANAYDISYERYLTKGTYFSVAYFYKDMLNYIRSETVPFDFTDYPNPSGATVSSYIGTMTTPVNAQGGHVEGIELSGAVDGGVITPWLSGFGAIGSFGRGWTDIHAGVATDPAKLPGLSGTVTNVTLFYEKHGFSARISERWRSAELGEVRQLYANLGATRILPDKQFDAQLSYDISSGPLKGMTLLLQAYNLTNSAYQTELQVSENELADGTPFPENYETYGTTWLFGFNYKFQ